MSSVFFIPLTLIAFFESQISHSRNQRIRLYFGESAPEDEGDPKIEDPGNENGEGEISTTKFEDLVKAFPKYVCSVVMLFCS